MAHGAPDHLSLRAYGPAHGSHAHDHVQVLVGLDGVLELEVEGRGRRVDAGEAALVVPGDRHDFESAAGSRCLVLDTRRELWSPCGTAPAQPVQVARLARYLATALETHQPLAVLHGPSLLLEAWAPARQAGQGHRPRRAIDWAALQAWADARLDQDMTVADLAAQVHLSPSQFALRWREVHGIGVVQWLRQQRLARARALRARGLPVAEAARRSGYRSPSALTAALRRQGLAG